MKSGRERRNKKSNWLVPVCSNCLFGTIAPIDRGPIRPLVWYNGRIEVSVCRFATTVAGAHPSNLLSAFVGLIRAGLMSLYVVTRRAKRNESHVIAKRTL
jgi:hypothetical protein